MKVKSMAETSELRKQYEELLLNLDKKTQKKLLVAMQRLAHTYYNREDEWRLDSALENLQEEEDTSEYGDLNLHFLRDDEPQASFPIPQSGTAEQETIDEYFMRLALKEAVQAYREDEVPVGAVLVSPKGEVLATAHNTAEHGLHAMAHAETVAMSVGAISLQQKRLWDCTLYVTLEPCAMCAAAMTHMRIKRLVYGASNPKGGAVENGVRFFDNPSCNHRPLLTTGVLSEECGDILTAFFRSKR